MNSTYRWRGGEEAILRLGDAADVTLLILPALFEEANRMRRFTVAVMRSLAARGIGSMLPDLPGTGESLIPLAEVGFDHWRDAVAALSTSVRAQERRCLTLAIRGGALLDGMADDGWRLAPETGERLLRDMVRATALTGGISARDLDARVRTSPITFAGNTISPALYTGLQTAALPDARRRTARLADDVAPADTRLGGTRLWRAAEPGDDPALVTAAVDDIAFWVAQCVA